MSGLRNCKGRVRTLLADPLAAAILAVLGGVADAPGPNRGSEWPPGR